MQHPPLTPQAALEKLNWRYATKQFDPARKIPDDHWHVLEQALILSPSSFGLQPWKFLVVDDPTIRQSLVPATWGQSQVADCSHFVALAYRKDLGSADVERLIARTVEVHGVSPDSLHGYRKAILQFQQTAGEQGWLDAWCSRQVYIALGSLMTTAAMMGIDSCPIEGFEPGKYDEILSLRDTGYHTVVACALGYRAASDRHATLPKVRYPRHEVLHRI